MTALTTGMPHFNAAKMERKLSPADGKVRPALRTIEIGRRKFFPRARKAGFLVGKPAQGGTHA